MKKVIDITLKVLLLVASGALAYMCYSSIMTPIEFNETKEAREKEIVARLIDIRKAETEYRNTKGDYTASFDTLLDFMKNEKAKVVLKEGELTDKQLEDGLTEKEAVKQGLIKRDTTYVPMLVAVFGCENYPIDSLQYIPYSNGQKFELNKAEIVTGSAGIQVKVMEAKAPYSSYLSDLNRQELINLTETQTKLEKYAGLKFGDIQQANNNAGNWE